jgi:two-component system sensor histidine kinase KdpD
VRSPVIGYAAALAGVSLVSLFIGFVLGQVSLANVSMLYLLAVMATAVGYGRGPAIFASVSAFLIFDFFFVQPPHQLSVSDPAEWVSLLFFLLTAIVTGQLAADQRQRAREARQREREAVVLYDVVRLLSEGSSDQVLEQVAERMRQELDVAAVGIELWQSAGNPRWVSTGAPDAVVGLRDSAGAAHVLHPAPGAVIDSRRTPARWVRIVQSTRSSSRQDVRLAPVRVSERRVGSVLLRGASQRFDAADDRLVAAVATQIGVAYERARLREEATEAEILRRTDQLRSALLNAVSHDLRTPLATIIASAGSLRQQDVAWTDEEREDFARAIEEEATHLNRLVGNLLDLSRIEGGSLRPQQSWQDMETVIDDVVDRLRPVTRRHHLRVHIADALPPIWLDPVEIGEVIYNLIENAAKYAPPGTDIDLTARTDSGNVEVSVADRGPGIPEAALAHVFDPFYRVVDGRTRSAGLGLGLAVVKGLVEAHSGRVWVESRVGGGARFAFTLPLKEVPAVVAPA